VECKPSQAVFHHSMLLIFAVLDPLFGGLWVGKDTVLSGAKIRDLLIAELANNLKRSYERGYKPVRIFWDDAARSIIINAMHAEFQPFQPLIGNAHGTRMAIYMLCIWDISISSSLRLRDPGWLKGLKNFWVANSFLKYQKLVHITERERTDILLCTTEGTTRHSSVDLARKDYRGIGSVSWLTRARWAY